MKITVLIENTVGKSGLTAEHGLCLYVETAAHRLLMDTGASELTWENAQALGMDISCIDTVVISHGHYDHAGGLLSFADRNRTADIYMRRCACGDFYHGERYIGIDKRITALPRLRLIDSVDRLDIDSELSLFSGITERVLWPKSNSALTERAGDSVLQDSFSHEQCLVISEGGKKVLLSGCAHNGILNILSRYHDIYCAYPDAAVTGFHMMKDSEYTADETGGIELTARELAKLQTVFFTGHCTGDRAFDIMKEIMASQLHRLHTGDEISVNAAD